ncbi:ferredoxin oxidoreductase [bacterium]|nr:MAG: ferredoxin oxidoreductase [bacterium]
MQKLLTGNQIIVQAMLDAGAEAFFGYPITPASEILEGWMKEAAPPSLKLRGTRKSKKLISAQTEDEISAGFALIGSVLAGKKAFTATSGPGNVIMQDAFSMAEAMRLPTVAFIMQRGGPSTGTVIYSQSEVNLTCFGGNGEGMRIVYSPSSLEELYRISQQALAIAWKYRFPVFILADGYQAKMRGNVEIPEKNGNEAEIEAFLLSSKKNSLEGKMPTGSYLQTKEKDRFCTSIRNCYNTEEELYVANQSTIDAFKKCSPEIEQCETINIENADTIIIAHGIVASAFAQATADKAADKAGLFRPITLNPFPAEALVKNVKNKKKIIIIESAYNQLGRIVKDALSGIKIEIEEVYHSGQGFTPDDIENIINN